ncbi:hypothetical protein KAI78_03595 [bacterium]|nr:hypothetical protein [bacterium]
MIATVSSDFSASADLVFQKVMQPSLLVEVASPVIRFDPIMPAELPTIWNIDQEYIFKIYLFKIIPMGLHRIQLVKIDAKNKQISSMETGKIAKVWNHTIIIEKDTDGNARYTDIVEIKAGVVTFFVYLFAQLFYRHRQRKWKNLLKGE